MGIRKAGMSRGRLTMIAAVVIVPFGALGIRNRMLYRVPIHEDSIAGLRPRLEVDGEEALEAQFEIERRVGAKSLQIWKDVLASQGPNARYLAADSVAKTRLPEGGPILAGLLTDYASRVRTCAVESLGAVKYKESIPTLVAALADDDTWVRESAVSQLAIRRDPKTVPALMRALHDSDRATASQATGALSRITGKPYRASFTSTPKDFAKAVGKWEKWWSGARANWPTDAALSSVRPISPSRIGPKAREITCRVGASLNSDFRLSEKRGRLVFLNFFGADCGPCIFESADIQKLYEEFTPQGLEVLGLEISADKPDALVKFADLMKVNYPMALGSADIIHDYGHIHDVPVTFLLDRHGRIRYQWSGQRDYETFSAAVRRLLAER